MAQRPRKERKPQGRGAARGKPLAVDVEANRGYGDERYEDRDERGGALEHATPEEPQADAHVKRQPLRPVDEAAAEK